MKNFRQHVTYLYTHGKSLFDCEAPKKFCLAEKPSSITDKDGKVFEISDDIQIDRVKSK